MKANSQLAKWKLSTTTTKKAKKQNKTKTKTKNKQTQRTTTHKKTTGNSQNKHELAK